MCIRDRVNRYLARILSGLPILEMVICDKDNVNTKKSTSYLIDGLQRLSYAESFKEDKITITKNGAERHLIQYKNYQVDENGNRVFDEDGNPIFEYEVFDIIGKKYRDLPDDLKDRFKEFNINVTRFFHCTDQQIADHIRPLINDFLRKMAKFRHQENQDVSAGTRIRFFIDKPAAMISFPRAVIKYL